MRAFPTIQAFAVAMILFTACGCPRSAPVAPNGQSPDASEEILVLCGSSFRLPMEKLKEMYTEETQANVALVFGGSEDHLPKVKDKVTGDVYVTHTPYMQYTRDADALLREVPVGFLAPVLVSQKGNPKKLAKFEDLAQPDLRLAVPNPDYSTCGEMVFDLLDTKYAHLKDDFLANVDNAMFRQHSEVASIIALGHCDAGIMWNGVANTWLDKIEVVPIPYEYEEIGVSVMGLSFTEYPEETNAFLDFVETHGPEVFAEFGYVK